MGLWLSESDVRAALPMADLVEAMESALAGFSSGCVIQPVRTAMELRDLAFFGSMPAYIRNPPVLGAKLVTVVVANRLKQLPTHQAVIVLFDPEVGSLLAVMDGRFITEVRTAAVSAVSVRLLACQDASVLAIIGSGTQARSHLAALPLVRKFHEVRAWSPTPTHLEEFVSSASTPVHTAASAEQAVRGAGVIVLATSSTVPVLEDEWVQAGAHVISIGACRPNHREVDPALLARARLFVDSRAAALQESGDIVLGIREGRFAEDHVVAELGEISCRSQRGRTSDQEITIFKSLGLAVEDLAAAGLAYRRARELGAGIEVSL